MFPPTVKSPSISTLPVTDKLPVISNSSEGTIVITALLVIVDSFTVIPSITTAPVPLALNSKSELEFVVVIKLPCILISSVCTTSV